MKNGLSLKENETCRLDFIESVQTKCAIFIFATATRRHQVVRKVIEFLFHPQFVCYVALVCIFLCFLPVPTLVKNQNLYNGTGF